MKKNLRFIFSFLLMLVCSIVGRAATGDVYKLVTNDSELKSGDIVVIASGTKAMGSSVSGGSINAVDVTVDNDMLSWKSGLGEVKLESTGSSWYLKLGNYYINSKRTGVLSVSNKDFETSTSKDSNKGEYEISIPDDSQNATIQNNKRNNYTIIRYESSSFKFGNALLGSNLQIYKKVKRPCGIGFSVKSAVITKNVGTHALPIVNPNGLSLTYTSSNPGVASVDTEGNVTPNTWGTTTITAAFAGNSTYMSGTAEYVLTVTDKKENIENRIVTFLPGTNMGTNTNTNSGSDSMTNEGVTVSSERAAFNCSAESYYLFYNGIMDITVDKGRIVMVEIEGSNQLSGVELADGCAGTYNVVSQYLHVWNGSSKTVSIKTGGSNAYISAIRVYVEYPELVFDENADNEISECEKINVTLNRSLVADKWNTLCLPFDVEGDNLVKLLGEGAKVTEYSSTDDEGTLKFTKVDKMVAGKPYLVKPTVGGKKYTFKGIEIKATEPTVDGDDIKFKGLFSPKDITEDGKAAGVTGTGAIKFAIGGTKTKAFRAYFVVPAATSTASLCLSIDGTVTAISDIVADTEDDANAPVYNLQGQRVDARSLTKGVYIKNGRKFVVNK